MNNVLSLFPEDHSPEPAPSRFEEFWQAYPSCRRERKALAKAKFDTITGPGLKTRTFERDSNSYVEIDLKADPDEIIAAARKYDQRMRKPGQHEFGYRDEGKFVCQPATWLNQGRFMDE